MSQLNAYKDSGFWFARPVTQNALPGWIQNLISLETHLFKVAFSVSPYLIVQQLRVVPANKGALLKLHCYCYLLLPSNIVQYILSHHLYECRN